jgi:8-oxo-dGTP diphosphatase
MILATLCYLQHAGSTLMIHRVKRADDIHIGKWNGLGGKFEPGESPEECVKREVSEESGLEIQKVRLCGVLAFSSFKGNDWYVFVFTAQQFHGELKENDEGYLEWIQDEQLVNLELWPSDHIFLPWIRQGRFFSAKFVYQGDAMMEYSVAFYP